MKFILFCIAAACTQTFAADVSFSGNWKGECFTYWGARPSELKIEQNDSKTFKLTRFGGSKMHTLDFSVAEKIAEQWEEDMDSHLEFKVGEERWSWCASSDQTKVCKLARWEQFSEFDKSNRTKWENHMELSLDEKGRLVLREMEYYYKSDGTQEVTSQDFCRFEK